MQPLHYHEVIQLPLFGLTEHLVALAKSDPEACQAALSDVAGSLRQGRAALKAIRLIVMDELEYCSNLERVERFHSALAWLPLTSLPEDEHAVVSRMLTISQQVAEARHATASTVQIELLKAQGQALREQRSLLNQGSIHVVLYYVELQWWEELIAQQVAALEQA